MAPQESVVQKLYKPYTRPFTRVVHGAPALWDQNTAAITCPFGICTAVWSPCNGFIAIPLGHPLDGTTVGVLDSVTLQQLQTLKLPQGMSTYYMELIFSPDSHILTCSGDNHWNGMSEELFVVSWDLQTGGIASTIRWKAPKWKKQPSMTYSANGKMVGVLCWSQDNTPAANIFICNIASSVYMHSHSLNADILLSNNIWTHGESLQFATADATTITIWEVEFISGGTPTMVETFPAPDNYDHKGSVHLLPTPCRLAFVFMGKVLVWDVWNSKCLLDCEDTTFFPVMSFSSNGCFFACPTLCGIYLWKESPTGYILHKVLQLQTRNLPIPLLSQNGESIAVSYGCTLQLWHTNSFTICSSCVFIQDPYLFDNFVLDFSPDGTLAVVARRGCNTITVLNLRSGVPQLTIDMGTRVNGLGVIGNIIAVIGDQKFIAWNIPVGGCVPDTGVGLGDASLTINLEDMAVTLNGSQGRWDSVSGVSISPDSHYIALTTMAFLDNHGSPCLYIYNASTGECLGHKLTDYDCRPWFAPDGHHIWGAATDSGEAAVWRVGSGGDILEDPEHLDDVKHPPEGYPWRLSYGYQVTDDWWILAPDGKRLLMLPPPWQFDAEQRVWKGQFLALLHGGLSEPVILELES